MDKTPQPKSAFPTTPQVGSLSDGPSTETAAVENVHTPDIDQRSAIPLSVADAPSQRLYASIIYGALMIWRLQNYISLCLGREDGFWLFTKWVGIDTAFLYGLSSFRIPWLRWSATTFTVLFIGHGILNWILMFQISIPIFSWLASVMTAFYDREMAIAEHRVQPANVLRNGSLILGKQIVNILPEGSAMLNPKHEPFCIGGVHPTVALPIQVNQTLPTLIELLRIDIDTSEQEVISISKKALRKQRLLSKTSPAQETSTHQSILTMPVGTPGIYHLQRMVDESSLDVRIHSSSATVVRCPRATIQKTTSDKCEGDLSNFNFVIEAVPPVKIKYARTIQQKDERHVILHANPQLDRKIMSKETIGADESQATSLNASIADFQSFQLPLNESLIDKGLWHYAIDEIEDAFGNQVNYSQTRLHGINIAGTSLKESEQSFMVHQRPQASFKSCGTQKPLRVEKGKSAQLPVHIESLDGPLLTSYLFTPIDQLQTGQTHSSHAELKTISLKNNALNLHIKEPGLYSLSSVASPHCNGDVQEPSSCMLLNPPEPDLDIATEAIPDKCAGKSIGLVVNLDPSGTPPFTVHYTVKKRGARPTSETRVIAHMHEQVELKPHDTGHYTYEFDYISDSVYRQPRSLLHKSLKVDQDVKAPPSAFILEADITRKACLDEIVDVFVQLNGESPFILEYDLVSKGKRVAMKTAEIQESTFKIQTGPFQSGGEHILVLTSLTDQYGCKAALQADIKIDIRPQRPMAAFGAIKGRHETSVVAGNKVTLPLRLQGESPWTVKYRRLEDSRHKITQSILHTDNAFLELYDEGTYLLLDVRDRSCTGVIDNSHDQFKVVWIPPPKVNVPLSPSVRQNMGDYEKKGVCQGDVDALEITFTGASPFEYAYDCHLKTEKGQQSVGFREIKSGLSKSAIDLDTGQAGEYQYVITKLTDALYDHDQRNFSPVLIRQRVFPRPSALFVDTKRKYHYCHNEEDFSETIPIQLSGEAPFHLEIEIRHPALSRQEIISVPNIGSDRHNLHVPKRLQQLGSHYVILRKVRDSRGCQQSMDQNAPRIHVNVADLPSISPLEKQRDYCVGDHISFALSGSLPFHIYYTFQDRERKARVADTTFRRFAEKPGDFIITAVSDQQSADQCPLRTNIVKHIHAMPSVRISKGQTSTIDIHEGGVAEILFEFGGTPPFHFTFIRSGVPAKGKERVILETTNEISYEHSKLIHASAEGVYEVVSIRDKYCSFSNQGLKSRATIKDH